jgi:molecular chaperone Hsp33
MADVMVRAITACGRFRAVAAITTGVAEAVRTRHRMLPVATAAVGRTLTGAFLLASELKGQGRLMIQILGSGPLGQIFAEADTSGNGRGYVSNPHVDFPAEGGKIQVGKGVGTSGLLTVIKDLSLKEPYRGVVPITSGEIGKDLAYYLTVSEQIPSAVALGVYVEQNLSVGVAGGYMVNTLPGAADRDIALVEANIRGLPMPSELIRAGVSPHGILQRVLRGFDLKYLGDQLLKFQCRCSEDRFSRALVAMGPQELKDLIEKEGGARITCEFCGETYSFPEDTLKGLLKTALRPQ